MNLILKYMNLNQDDYCQCKYPIPRYLSASGVKVCDSDDCRERQEFKNNWKAIRIPPDYENSYDAIMPVVKKLVGDGMFVEFEHALLNQVPLEMRDSILFAFYEATPVQLTAAVIETLKELK